MSARLVKNNVAPQQNGGTIEESDMRAFLMVVRQALLMIVRFIEKRYGLTT